MTAVYIPSSPPPTPAPPGRGMASVAFSGLLEVTGPDNAAIMQKAVFMGRAARVGEAWISGIDGMDGEASGATVIRFSNRPHDQPDGATVMDLTLAAGQSRARVAGEVSIVAGGWLYIFFTHSTGGHWGAQVGFEISWQE